MADDKNIMNDDDFEKLLNDFINGDSSDEDESKESLSDKKRQTEQQAAAIIADDYVEKTENDDENDKYLPNLDEVQSELAQAKADYEEQENQQN